MLRTVVNLSFGYFVHAMSFIIMLIMLFFIVIKEKQEHMLCYHIVFLNIRETALIKLLYDSELAICHLYFKVGGFGSIN